MSLNLMNRFMELNLVVFFVKSSKLIFVNTFDKLL